MAPKTGKRPADDHDDAQSSRASKQSRSNVSGTKDERRPFTIDELKDIKTNPGDYGFANHPLLEVVKGVHNLAKRETKKDPKAFYEYQFTRFKAFERLEEKYNEVEKEMALPPDSRRLKKNITAGKTKAGNQSVKDRKFDHDHFVRTFADDPEKRDELKDVFFPDVRVNKGKAYFAFEDFESMEKTYGESDPESGIHRILKDILYFAPAKKRFDDDKAYIDNVAIRYSGLNDVVPSCDDLLKGDYKDDETLKRIRSSLYQILSEIRRQFRDKIGAEKFKQILDADDEIEDKENLDDYHYRLMGEYDLSSDDPAPLDLMAKVSRYSVIQDQVLVSSRAMRSNNDEVLEECNNDAIKALATQVKSITIFHERRDNTFLQYCNTLVKACKTLDQIKAEARGICNEESDNVEAITACQIVISRAESKWDYARKFLRREVNAAGDDILTIVRQNIRARRQIQDHLNTMERSKAPADARTSEGILELKKELASIPSMEDLNYFLEEGTSRYWAENLRRRQA